MFDKLRKMFAPRKEAEELPESPFTGDEDDEDDPPPKAKAVEEDDGGEKTQEMAIPVGELVAQINDLIVAGALDANSRVWFLTTRSSARGTPVTKVQVSRGNLALGFTPFRADVFDDDDDEEEPGVPTERIPFNPPFAPKKRGVKRFYRQGQGPKSWTDDAV